MNITEQPIGELTDGMGAAHILQCSHDSIRMYAKKGQLRAFQFVDGELVQRVKGESTRGKDLLLLRSDLAAFERRPAHRPRKREGDSK